jgi:iron(III) transport system substrate-binding protein
LIWGTLFAGIIIFLIGRSLDFFKPSREPVIVYCAQDQVYAEPVFEEFETETGIAVRPVYDNEAVKTVGLANRLLAERNNPQCDVFWGNEEMRTRQLAGQNVFRQTNGWSAFGFRSRRIVINTNLCSADSAPRSLIDLTNSTWQGKVAMAYPQFGTTATHIHALRARWGEDKWETWCHALMANKVLLVDGNSAVAKAVGQGEAWLGLTDSDDIADGQREGLPIAALPMTAETLLIPNTVAVIRNAPHLQAAQRLFEYLQRPEVAQRLIASSALEGAATDEVRVATLSVDWQQLLHSLDSTTAKLNQVFLR